MTQTDRPVKKYSPFLWPLRLAKAVVKLPDHITNIYVNQANAEKKDAEIMNALSELIDKLTDSQQRIDQVNSHLLSVDKRLVGLEKVKKVLELESKSGSNIDKKRFADNHSLDTFYVGFEDNFRGNEDQIAEKVKIYPELFMETIIDYKKYPVIDLGCGRGELLKAFKGAGIRSIGLDINYEMVERAKKSGLEAVQSDALTYLNGLKDSSIGGITGMHLIEHIPFEELFVLYKEAYRVLVPGGKVIFETPNP